MKKIKAQIISFINDVLKGILIGAIIGILLIATGILLGEVIVHYG